MPFEAAQFQQALRRPLRPIKREWVRLRRRRSLGPLARYVNGSEEIAGWARGLEAVELARVAQSLPGDAVIVEIGSFLGSSAVLLAGGRKVADSGIVHCVDPFDGSGDVHSVPVYREILDPIPTSIRNRFDENVRSAGVSEWVTVHEGTAEAVSSTWSESIDMLFLDGDQSPVGARSAYEAWEPFLKPGGAIAVHNSADRLYAPEHDGHRRVVVEFIIPPKYTDIRCVGSTTFAKRVR